MPETRQLFKVRRIGRNAEAVLHAPIKATGYYSMEYDEKTGAIHYYPVKVRP
jgi:hypothetical protein